MLTIYKSRKYVKEKHRIVKDINGYFKDNFIGKIKLNKFDKRFIKLVGESNDLEKLTDGSKFVLLLSHSKELGFPILDFDSISTFTKPIEEIMDYVWLIPEGYLIKEGTLGMSIFREANDVYHIYVDENGAYVKDIEDLLCWRSGMRNFY